MLPDHTPRLHRAERIAKANPEIALAVVAPAAAVVANKLPAPVKAAAAAATCPLAARRGQQHTISTVTLTFVILPSWLTSLERMAVMRAVLIGAWAMVALLPASIGAAMKASEIPSHDAEVIMADYADCVVKQPKRRVAVAAFLRAIPDTEQAYRTSLKAADMRCLDAKANATRSIITMRMQPSSFRDALYPALYRADHAKTGVDQTVSQRPAPVLAAEYDGDASTIPAVYQQQRILGDCVAKSAPAAAHDMLVATPWSAADTAAVESLKPAIASCLSQGQTIRMNRAALRAYVGEAMYKLSHSPT